MGNFEYYSERQNNLSFTIAPPGDAHDFCKEESAFTRSKNRRSERQKQKFLSFTIIYLQISSNDIYLK